jgi:hypothetical protein
MFFSVYLRKGVVYLPTTSRFISGSAAYRDADPVEVVPASDGEGLRRALHATIARGNPYIPASAGDPPVVLKHAGVRSWSAFERETFGWAIEDDPGVWQITAYRRRADRGMEEDPNRITRMPPGSGLDALCDRLIAMVQAKAREPAAPR